MRDQNLKVFFIKKFMDLSSIGNVSLKKTTTKNNNFLRRIVGAVPYNFVVVCF